MRNLACQTGWPCTIGAGDRDFSYLWPTDQIPVAMNCVLCNKPITDPQSMERGVGPDCWEQLRADLEKNTGRFVDRYCGKFDGDVVLMRGTDGAPMSNIPHKVLMHSPTGYEWGFNGKGPADLALNILLQFARADVAIRWHQQFKHDFLVKLPKEGGKLSGKLVRKWLEGKTLTLF